MLYNSTVTLGGRLTDDQIDQVIDDLEGHGPVVSRDQLGSFEVIVTVTADTLKQATSDALALVEHAADRPAIATQTMPTDRFDRLNGIDPVPPLVSVTEAAELLGVTRQAIAQRIDAGTLPATKVGSTYAIPRAAVTTAESTAGAEDRLADLAGKFRRTPREVPPAMAKMLAKIEKERQA